MVDDLERRRLLRRRADPTDRRVRTLHLTPQGREMLRQLTEVAAAHEKALCVGLKAGEREQRLSLLRKANAGLALSDTVHSGLAGPDWRPAVIPSGVPT